MPGYRVLTLKIMKIKNSVCFLLWYCLCINASIASNGDLALDHNAVRWSSLVYEASAFFVTLDTKVSLNKVNKDSDLKFLVLEDNEDVSLPRGDKFFRIDTFAEGFGKNTRYQLWFDNDGSILQRKKIVKGDKNEIKIYRYSQCGHYRMRKKFPDEDFEESYDKWKMSEVGLTSYPASLCEGNTVYDANTLLYLISALNLKSAGYERQLQVVSRGRLFTVKLHAKKMTSIYADYKLRTQGEDETIEDDVNVLEVRIMPVTDVKEELDSFKFLGLKGRVRVYVDTEKQLILRLRGEVKVLGKVDINLKKAVLRQ